MPFRPAPFAPDEALKGRDLRGVPLRRVDLAGRDLSEADLRQADLTAADLREVCLERADLSEAVLDRAILEGADLDHAILERASLERASLSRSTLRGARLAATRLSDSELDGADLSRADLSGASLCFANLRGASLVGAKLDRANLRGADLEDATFTDASVQGTRLDATLGLGRATRRALKARGAAVAVWAGAIPWSRFDAFVRRRQAALFLGGLGAAVVVAVATGVWVGRDVRAPAAFALRSSEEGMLYEVDCGGSNDLPFAGQVGHVGGEAGRAPQRIDLPRDRPPPPLGHLTHRRGASFDYRFRLSPGWYEVRMHFIELVHRLRGARTFDIRIEDELVARRLDILARAGFAVPLVLRFGAWTDDGTLDLSFRAHRDLAQVDLIVVRRLSNDRSMLAPAPVYP